MARQTIQELSVRIGAEINEALTKFDALGDRATRMGRRISDVGDSLTRKVSLPLLAIGAASLKVAADFESLDIGLKAVTGSADEAARQMTRLREIAKLPSVDLEQATKASIAFQSIGRSAEFAERTIKGVANAVALSGGTGEEFGGVMRQLRQVASLGRLMGEELNTILENAPAMAAALQHAFGTTSADAIRKLNLSTDEFFRRLQEGMESLPQVAGGAANSFQNLGQALREAGDAIGSVLLPVVVPLTDRLSDWFSSLREVNPAVIQWGVALGTVAAVAGPLLILVGKLTTGVIALSAALTIGLLPMIAIGGPIIVGLGLLAAWFVKSKIEALSAASATDRLAAATERLRQRVGELTGEQLLARKAQLEMQLVEQRQDVLRLQRAVESTSGRLRDSMVPAMNRARAAMEATGEELKIVEQQMRDMSTLPPITVSATARPVVEMSAALERLRELGGRLAGDGGPLFVITRQAEKLRDVFGFEISPTFDLLAEKTSVLGEHLKATFVTGLDAVVDFATGAGNSIEAFVKHALRELAKLLLKMALLRIFEGATGGVGGFIFDALGGNAPGRAVGGPVMANQAYMVGERGPELFVPHSAGNVVPNQALGRPIVFQVNVPPAADAKTLARDAQWQEAWRETALVAESQGFQFAFQRG